MKKVQVLLFLLLLTSCEYKVNDYPPQPAMTIPPYLGAVQIAVYWHQNVDEIAQFCPKKDNLIVYECALTLKTGSCVIHALQPKDFNDTPKLAMLGHEFLHCLGAQHG